MKLTRALAAMLAISLAACASGGVSGTPPTPAQSSPPSSTPATVTGTVVDFDSNSGLPGVAVAIASPGASPQPVATTSADGSFRFTTAPGQYNVVVGSNSAAPADNRASYHFSHVLRAGANVLAAASPNPDLDHAPFPAQLSGNIRLAVMSAPEQLCLSGMNAGRAANGLSALIPDEYLLETARVWVNNELAQASAGGSINVLPTQAIGFTTLFIPFPTMQELRCDSWTGTQSFTAGDAAYKYATNATATLYGASQGVLGDPNQSNFSEAGMQAWQ